MRDFRNSTNVLAPWVPQASTLALLAVFAVGLTQLDVEAYTGGPKPNMSSTSQPGTSDQQGDRGSRPRPHPGQEVRRQGEFPPPPGRW